MQVCLNLMATCLHDGGKNSKHGNNIANNNFFNDMINNVLLHVGL